MRIWKSDFTQAQNINSIGISVRPSVPFWIGYCQRVGKVKDKMQKKILIKLPEGMNPDSLLTFKAASQISGVPVSMLYEWRRNPGKGMQVYRFGRRIFVQAEEFVRWANARIQTA